MKQFRWFYVFLFMVHLASTASAQKKPVQHAHKAGNAISSKALPLVTLPDTSRGPIFPGIVTKYLSDKINYPESAKENGVEGVVSVRFIVDEKGTTTQVRIAKSINSSLDQEALRIVKGMPKWQPALFHGRACKWPMILPVVFRLE